MREEDVFAWGFGAIIIIPIAVFLVVNVYFWWRMGSWVGKTYRNREKEGGQLGLLLGAFGMLAVLGYSDLRRKCPACYSPEPDDAKVCSNCRKQLPLVLKESMAVASKPSDLSDKNWNDPIPKDWKP